MVDLSMPEKGSGSAPICSFSSYSILKCAVSVFAIIISIFTTFAIEDTEKTTFQVKCRSERQTDDWLGLAQFFVGFQPLILA